MERAICIGDINYRDILVKSDKEKNIKCSIVDGDLYGEIIYEIQQGSKGEVLLKLESNAIDADKRPFQTKEFLSQQLNLHKNNIEK